MERADGRKIDAKTLEYEDPGPLPIEAVAYQLSICSIDPGSSDCSH